MTGPDRLEPGLAPRGLVFRVYDLGGRQLSESRVTRPDAAEAAAARDAAAAGVALASGAPVVLVVFDGDSGERVLAYGLA